MKKNISKEIIVKNLFYKTGLPSSILEKFLDSVFEYIIEQTSISGQTKISNFGSFYRKHKNKRVGRNINTKTSVEVTARNVISFYPSSHLKKVLND